MKILLIGSGGREHAIALKLSQSLQNPQIIIAPGNPGMESLGECKNTLVEDFDNLLKLAQEEKPTYTIVGPEVPLVNGIVDLFQKNGFLIFGPTALAARLEGSKAFSKNFMKKYRIPTASFKNFTNQKEALSYLKHQSIPIVVKASGLAAGKGAVVCGTIKLAQKTIEDMFSGQFGEASSEIVIEEFMEGIEASLFAICDGENYVLLDSAQDYKRIGEGDQGLNTGGMGAYSPTPIITSKVLQEIRKNIIEPTLKGMVAEGCPYTGVLYVGVMVTKDGSKVVEYNCRFGDPETQVILPNYDGDFVELIGKAVQGQLKNFEVKNSKNQSSVIVVLSAEGYPEDYKKGEVIYGLSNILPVNTHVIHAGTTTKDQEIVSNGGRVLGLVSQADTLKEAVDLVYKIPETVYFKNMYYRKDIAQKGLDKI